MQRAPIQTFSTAEALDLLRKGSGSAYFVPSGYIPILVPDSDEDPETMRQLLEAHVPTQVPVDNLWQTRLPTKVMRTKRKRPERQGPAKKPPRPPNAFILYRKDNQKTVQENHAGITNNEVSKVIGDMWKQESQEVKDHYQALAQQSREQHQKEYPGYKYAPRRPGERKRRGVHHEIVFGDSETGSNTGESVNLDVKSPGDYELSPGPTGEYFRFAHSSSYYQDMLITPTRVDSNSPDEYNLSQLNSSQQTPHLTSDAEQGWAHTPTVDHISEIGLDAGHPDLDYDGPHNAYGIYQDTSFEREPVRFHSVAIDGDYKYLNPPISSGQMTSPLEWAAQQALMVEDIYSGSTDWMSPPMTAQPNV